MIWRDCNNDGFIDVFFSNGNDMAQAGNTIYLSQLGQLPTSASWFSMNREYSGHSAVGDINDDGLADFVVANYLGSSWGIPNRGDLYLNNGYLPSPVPYWHTPDSIFSFSCALGDVDSDGDLDIAFATGEGYGNDYQRDIVYLNENGTFGDTAAWRSADSTAALDVTWGDVDSDGDLDLALCYDDAAVAVYYNNNGLPETTPSWQAATAEPGNTLVFGDINNDGWLDLVVAYNNQLGGDGYFSVYYNDGAGNLNPNHGWQSQDGGYGSALALYDYDNDGDDDLAAGRWWQDLFIYENLSGILTTTPVWRTDIDMVAEELAWVDIDGDGVEHVVDTITVEADRRLFYTKHHPLNAIDSVVVDGTPIEHAGFCYDLVSGWVSLAETPQYNIIVHYRYSFKNDLTVANWDTASMAFGNTGTPYVDFYADTTVGWAPLSVQFSDSSAGAYEWLWRFDDGDSSTLQHPTHTFVGGGPFDICLEVMLPDGYHSRTQHSMILTLADTLFFTGEAVPSPGTVTLPVVLKNNYPLHEIILPVSYSGHLTLDYLGWDTDSCRTDYFENITVISHDIPARKILFQLRPKATTGGVPLAPGYGPIINLNFHQDGFGLTMLDTTTVDSMSLNLDALYLAYQPAVVAGYIYHGACGNLDGSPDGVVDISDATALIDYLFITYTPPLLIEQANVDGSPDGIIDISDLTYLIKFLFLDGPPPVCL